MARPKKITPSFIFIEDEDKAAFLKVMKEKGFKPDSTAYTRHVNKPGPKGIYIMEDRTWVAGAAYDYEASGKQNGYKYITMDDLIPKKPDSKLIDKEAIEAFKLEMAKYA